MKYFVFSINRSFSANSAYNEVDEISPLMAACLFASNEEVINGVCDDAYNVFSASGKLIECVNVLAKDCLLTFYSDNTVKNNTELTEPIDSTNNNGSFDSLDTDADGIEHSQGKNDICSISQGGVEYHNSGEPLEFGSNGSFWSDGKSDFSDEDEYGTNSCCGDDISALIDKMLQPDLDKADRQYNPMIANAFLKNSKFSQRFVDKYSFYIAKSSVNVVGEPKESLCIVIVENGNSTVFPDCFNTKEVDQLHNVFAVLLKCGIICTEYGANVFMGDSKRWNFDQIAGISKGVLCKCGLQYTGKPNFSNSLPEFDGSYLIPSDVSFLK